MKLYLFSFFLCLFIALPVVAQQTGSTVTLNKALQSELLKRGEEDQKLRTELQDEMIKMSTAGTKPTPEYFARWKKQEEIDLKNMQRLEEIIKQYGWPGKSLVGEEASKQAFLILQHSDVTYQKRYFPVLKEAAMKGEARLSDAAMMEDRILMREGKKQIYGTQLRSGDDTGGKLVIYPIEDEENVDARRAAVGLPPMAEYVKYFGLEYKPPKKQ